MRSRLLLPAGQMGLDLTGQSDKPAPLVRFNLTIRTKPNSSGIQIDLLPRQFKNRRCPPSGIERQQDEAPDMGLRMSNEFRRFGYCQPPVAGFSGMG